MKQLNVTELDFDQIATNLKAFFKRADSPFKDWDFSGSGLSLLIDVLAYNTHYNAMLAHIAVNESFLGSAQLRKNVVGQRLWGICHIVILRHLLSYGWRVPVFLHSRIFQVARISHPRLVGCHIISRPLVPRQKISVLQRIDTSRSIRDPARRFNSSLMIRY